MGKSYKGQKARVELDIERLKEKILQTVTDMARKQPNKLVSLLSGAHGLRDHLKVTNLVWCETMLQATKDREDC